MPSKLELYNAALREIGAERLASLTEAHERRYVLDDVYDLVLADCLEAGQWNFAIRSVKAESDTGVDPTWGHEEVFGKPSDWVRTVGFSTSEFSVPTMDDTEVRDEAGEWLTSQSPVYVSYVSNGANYGGDLTKWPASYRRFVEVSLAARICMRITQDGGMKQYLDQAVDRLRRDALVKDAMNEGPKRKEPSSWVLSRGGGSWGDRGSRSRLLG